MGNSIKQCVKMIRRFAFQEACEYAVYTALSALSTPLSAVLIQWCINSVTGGERWNSAISYVALAGVLLLSIWLGHGKRVADVALNEALIKHCTPVLVDKLNRIQYSYFDSMAAADVMEQMNRNPAEALGRLYKTLVNCMALIIRIFGVALLYFQLSVPFGITLVLLMAVEIAVGVVSNKEFGRLYNAELPKERKLSYIGKLLCQKEAIFDLKLNQSIGYMKNIQQKLAKSLLKERVRINLKAERYYLINVFLMLVWTAALLYSLVKGCLDGTVGLGLFSTLVGSYPLLTQYQSELSYYLSSMGKSWILIHALQDFFAYGEVETTEILPDGSPEIHVSHVSFQYPGTETYVLRDVTFTMSVGRTIALVGANGSGKSTIVKLLCGLYEPTEGTITVHGKPISKLSPAERKKLFAAVFQDFQTYAITVGENVGLGDVRYLHDEEKIASALKKAKLDGTVDALPRGIRTNLDHLEEGGVSLSGGQRQRLAIARAYVPDARFYLLDEPTAAMDPVAESHLYQNFTEMIGEKGALLVSHRLASSMIADEILVLEDGQILQRGTHSQLLAREGLYKQMFDRQSSWYAEERG